MINSVSNVLMTIFVSGCIMFVVIFFIPIWSKEQSNRVRKFLGLKEIK